MDDRAEILEVLASHSGGLTITQLVGMLGTSAASVRRQVSALVAAGSVATLRDEPAGPGRPALRFRLSSPARGWPCPIRALLSSIGPDGALEEGALMAIARATGASMVGDGVPGDVIDIMAQLGFAPRDRGPGPSCGELVSVLSFEACPFVDPTATRPILEACALHQGLIEGMANTLGGSMASFEIHESTSAACRVRLRWPGAE